MFRRSQPRNALGLGLAAAAALVFGLTLVAPTRAESVVKQLISFACFDHKQCLSITNVAADGNAIVGVAQNNHGIVGRTNVNTNRNPNLDFPMEIANAGVAGVDASTNPLDTNSGVLGTSTHGNGVVGVTTSNSNNEFHPQGVLGLDLSTMFNSNGGVTGFSNNNAGVIGVSPNVDLGAGVVGEDDGSAGVVGQSFADPAGNSIGVLGLAFKGYGMLAINSDPTGAALGIRNNFGGPVMNAFGGSMGNTEVMLLDNAGNLTITGKLIQHGAPMVVSATTAGRDVVTYAPQQSERTMEDVGEGQLAGGQAAVRLEPTFASTIDVRRSYLVFITPQGDSNGLYVSQKTAGGFVVREHNGASNIVFDYRIVAHPYGSSAQRLPLYTGTHNAAAVEELGMIRRQVSNMSRFRVRSARLRHLRFHP